MNFEHVEAAAREFPIAVVCDALLTTAGPTTTDSSTSGSTATSSTDSMTTATSAEDTTGPPPLDFPADGTCDPWTQNCAPGQKCTFTDSGSGDWDGVKCVDVVDDPAHAGEACLTPNGTQSGEDTCDATSMCFDTDPRTNEGVCRSFCIGSPTAPQCPVALDYCSLSESSILTLCFPHCHPLTGDCAPDEVCVPIDNALICAPDASGDSGAYGDLCEFVNVCDPGLACVAPERVPGCTGDYGCCSPFCELGGAVACPGAGQTCVPYYDPAPPLYEDLGICLLE